MKYEISLRKSVYFVSLVDRISSLRLRTGKPELIWCLSGWDKKSFSGAISVQNGFTNLLLVIPFCTEIVFPLCTRKYSLHFPSKKWPQGVKKSGSKTSKKVVPKCPKKLSQSVPKSVPKVIKKVSPKWPPKTFKKGPHFAQISFLNTSC